LVPGINSIPNSTSREGGNPGNSSANTSGNSLITSMSATVLEDSLSEVTTTLAKKASQPLPSILCAFKPEISTLEERFLGHWKTNSFSPGVLNRTLLLLQSRSA